MVLRRLALLALLCLACGGHPRGGVPPGEVSTDDPRDTLPSTSARAWYLRAMAAEERGDLVEAERALSWVLRHDGHNAWALLAWGRFLERQRRNEEAQEAFEQAVERQPSEPEALYSLGNVLIRREDPERGQVMLERAVQAGHQPEAFHLLARTYLRQRDMLAARQLHTAWRVHSPTSPEEALHRGRLALSLDQPGEAVDDLIVALQAPWIHPATGELLVDAAERSCRLGTAWRWAQGQSLPARPDRQWADLALRIGQQVGDWRMVAAAQAERESMDVAGQLQTAQIALDSGHAKQALSLLESVKPSDEVAWLQVRAWAVLGDLEQARDVIDATPWSSSQQQLRMRARWMGWNGSPSVGADLLKKGDELADWRHRAVLLEQAGERDQATALWSQIVDATPSDAEAWVALARLTPSDPALLQRARELEPCGAAANRLDLERAPEDQVERRMQALLEVRPLEDALVEALAARLEASGQLAESAELWEQLARHRSRPEWLARWRTVRDRLSELESGP